MGATNSAVDATGDICYTLPAPQLIDYVLVGQAPPLNPAIVAMQTQKTGLLNAEKKLALAAIVVTCVTGYMAYVGGSTTWQYYLSVEESLAEGPSLIGKRIRVNGTVTPDSLAITEDRKSATFRLKGAEQDLSVVCSGTLPDNLAEGMQVVVEGELQRDGWLQGEQVLTRCASKYQAQPSGLAQVSRSTGLRSVR
jgi:cytochrome c-type biogenesis protein CcmE